MKHTINSSIVPLCLQAFTALIVSQAATAANVCVHPAGGKCHATVAAAIAAAAPGDTVNLAPGVYYEEALMIDKPLTLKGSTKAVIDAGKIPDATDTTPPISLIHGSKHAVFISSNNVKIEGITIRNSRFNGIQFNDNTPAATISNVVIRNAGAYCINAGSGNHNVTIVGSILLSCELNGIRLVGDHALIAKNRIGHTGDYGIEISGNGATLAQNRIGEVSLEAITVIGHDALIENNQINAGDDNAISISGDNPLVTGNRISGGYGSGVDVNCVNCGSARIAKNLIANSGAGDYPSIYTYSGSPGLLIDGNSIANGGGAGIFVESFTKSAFATVSKNKIADTGAHSACIESRYAGHVVSGNQLAGCRFAGITATGDGTQILGNAMQNTGFAGVFAANNNIGVANNKIAGAAGFGVVTLKNASGIAIAGNQLKDNRGAICDAAAGTSISGNSGGGMVWTVGTTFGTQGVDDCEIPSGAY